MSKLFADLPEAIANTLELSSRLEFDLKELGYEFPVYPVPDGETHGFLSLQKVMGGRASTLRKDLRRVCKQLANRISSYRTTQAGRIFSDRLGHGGFYREKGIMVQGRGSAANSTVCYVLKITAVDPIKMELLFERFLSEQRGEMPDIDLDLPSGDQREKVIQYVYQKYGKRGAAMTANVCTYRGRSAAREMGKVLGFDEDTLSRLSKIMDSWEWRDPADTSTKSSRTQALI